MKRQSGAGRCSAAFSRMIWRWSPRHVSGSFTRAAYAPTRRASRCARRLDAGDFYGGFRRRARRADARREAAWAAGDNIEASHGHVSQAGDARWALAAGGATPRHASGLEAESAATPKCRRQMPSCRAASIFGDWLGGISGYRGARRRRQEGMCVSQKRHDNARPAPVRAGRCQRASRMISRRRHRHGTLAFAGLESRAANRAHAPSYTPSGRRQRDAAIRSAATAAARKRRPQRPQQDRLPPRPPTAPSVGDAGGISRHIVGGAGRRVVSGQVESRHRAALASRQVSSPSRCANVPP